MEWESSSYINWNRRNYLNLVEKRLNYEHVFLSINDNAKVSLVQNRILE